MREKPILFSGEMVRAILDGRKTQTRRVVKPQPVVSGTGVQVANNGTDDLFFVGGQLLDKCPYGRPGDSLWVRETWQYVDVSLLHATVGYKDNESRTVHLGESWEMKGRNTWNWQPSIFMPRWASRITLEVTAVRVERVQDIGEGDAIAEGVIFKGPYYGLPKTKEYDCDTARYAFADVWHSINAKRGYGWDSNCWVWVVEFKRVEEK